MIHNGEIIHMSDSYDFLNIWPIGDSCKKDCYKQNGVFSLNHRFAWDFGNWLESKMVYDEA